MASRDSILAYLDDYLGVRSIKDYGPQGLQVEGSEEVETLVTGVSATLELFERAVGEGAQMVMAHHGILWDRDSRVIRGPVRRRLELLLENRITLAGYHLCLDAHPEIGNNILAARGLGLSDIQPFGIYDGFSIGFRGSLPAVPVDQVVERLNSLYGSQSLVFNYGPERVRTIGIISGGAQKMLGDAIEAGLDMYVTGEASENVMYTARESGIHFVAAGHHNTERLGIRALGDHVAERFQVRHRFVDIPNPV